LSQAFVQLCTAFDCDKIKVDTRNPTLLYWSEKILNGIFGSKSLGADIKFIICLSAWSPENKRSLP
jgi:hypothetical protein